MMRMHFKLKRVEAVRFRPSDRVLFVCFKQLS